MANKPKTKAVLTAENEALKAQLEAMQKESAPADSGKNDEIEISMTKYIKVMSLCPNRLNLSTESRRGKFKFNKFGEVKRVMYKDLVEVMELQDSFLQAGLFLILDKDVVRLHGLDDVYERILDGGTIEKLITGELSNEALSLFLAAPVRQQDAIVDLIIRKLVRDDESVDMNFVFAIEKGTDRSITQRVQEAKEYNELNEKANKKN